jgi:ankyrin repeat protein
MIEALDEFGRSRLHYAALEGDEIEVSRLILLGEDIDLSDRSKWTPLHFAAQTYSYGVVSLLIKSGAVVDAQDDFGNTPLSTAVFNCQDRGGSVIRLLREAAANPYIENKYGVSPFSLAKTIGNYDVAQYFSDLEEIEREDT